MGNKPRFHQLYVTIWRDPTIRNLSPVLFRLYSYCLSSPHSNLIGCYHLPLGYIKTDLGFESEEELKRALGQLIEADLISYDYEAEYLLNKKHLFDNKIEGKNQATGAVNILSTLGNTILLSELLEIVYNGPKFGYMNGENAKLVSNEIEKRIAFWNSSEPPSNPLPTPSSISKQKKQKEDKTGKGGYGGEQVTPLSDPNGSDVFGKISTEDKDEEYITAEEFQIGMKDFLQ